MGFLLFLKTFLIYALAGAVILAIVCRFFRWTKENRLKSILLVLLLSITAGYGAGRITLKNFIIAETRDIESKGIESGNQVAYLIGDFIPIYRAIGGGLPEEARPLLERLSQSESLCTTAMARQGLDEKIDVQAACREAASKNVK